MIVHRKVDPARWPVWISGLGIISLLLAGCGRKEPENTPAPPTTNRAQVEEAEPVLSAGDAAVLGAGKPATEADRAWEQVANAFNLPSEPLEWHFQEPSKEEVAAFGKTNGVLAAKAADKAKDFYTRFPTHEKAAEARQQEYALLSLAVQLGNTNRVEQLRQIEEARLKDPGLSEDDRLELRIQQLQRSVNDKETNMVATLTQLEKGARNLQKEFPKRPEVASLLLSVAQGWLDNSETEKGRTIARELAEGAADEEIKANAQELLKKIERILYDDAALLPLHWQHLSWAARKNVRIDKVVNVIDMPYLGDLVIE